MELQSNVNDNRLVASPNDVSVELACEMSGFIRRDESLTWVGPTGQTVVSGSNRHQITYTNGTSPQGAANGSDILVPTRVSTLTISNPEPSDSGNYTCRVIETLQAVAIELIVNGSLSADSTTTRKSNNFNFAHLQYN